MATSFVVVEIPAGGDAGKAAIAVPAIAADATAIETVCPADSVVIAWNDALDGDINNRRLHQAIEVLEQVARANKFTGA